MTHDALIAEDSLPTDALTPNDISATVDAAVTLIDLAAEIVAAYVAHNSLPAIDLPGFIRSVYGALARLGKAEAPASGSALIPAVPIKKSITEDFMICLEDGRNFKSLRRHLQTAYGMTPERYRAKWGLPTDYPMVAPGYTKARSELAKSIGLGSLRKKG